MNDQQSNNHIDYGLDAFLQVLLSDSVVDPDVKFVFEREHSTDDSIVGDVKAKVNHQEVEGAVQGPEILHDNNAPLPPEYAFGERKGEKKKPPLERRVDSGPSIDDDAPPVHFCVHADQEHGNETAQELQASPDNSPHHQRQPAGQNTNVASARPPPSQLPPTSVQTTPRLHPSSISSIPIDIDPAAPTEPTFYTVEARLVEDPEDPTDATVYNAVAVTERPWWKVYERLALGICALGIVIAAVFISSQKSKDETVTAEDVKYYSGSTSSTSKASTSTLPSTNPIGNTTSTTTTQTTPTDTKVASTSTLPSANPIDNTTSTSKTQTTPTDTAVIRTQASRGTTSATTKISTSIRVDTAAIQPEVTPGCCITVISGSPCTDFITEEIRSEYPLANVRQSDQCHQGYDVCIRTDYSDII